MLGSGVVLWEVRDRRGAEEVRVRVSGAVLGEVAAGVGADEVKVLIGGPVSVLPDTLGGGGLRGGGVALGRSCSTAGEGCAAEVGGEGGVAVTTGMEREGVK